MSFKIPSVANFTQSMSAIVTGRGGDGRYFTSTKKGELQELKEELHSNNKDKKKDAVKKIIAAMTTGKDVSALFPDVVNCIQTSNIELKKLVYLYIINYAKAQPELAVLAINTFRKDSSDSNPLIRALAVRTMGCIRLEQVVEYLVEPLRRACRDPDPYVRKTAATGICKLYDTSPQTVEEQGFVEILTELLSDNNPTVVANALASLTEISEASGKDYLAFNEASVGRLLIALGESSEWAQVFILDALSLYNPPNPTVAASILERVTARLSHANPAVVLSTIRVILKMLHLIKDPTFIRNTQKKLAPPLITLLSAEAEIQYVALRNINLILQVYPGILANEVKTFFCKYNDPHYVKLEKLEIMVRLTGPHNIADVLMELREYINDVDIEFVRRSVRAIGRLGICFEKAANNCVTVLLSLLESGATHVVQETVVMFRDLFRRYPNRFEGAIPAITATLNSLDEVEAKAALIWIVGEYAERIENAKEILATFIEGFLDEPLQVRQQLLTSTVKLFLKCPSKAQDLITHVLKLSTEESDDPDLRDRGFIYWRLLSCDPKAARNVVLGVKPEVPEFSFLLPQDILSRLIQNISTVSSVFHKLPEEVVTRVRLVRALGQGENSEASESLDEKVSPDKIRSEMEQQSVYDSSNETTDEEIGSNKKRTQATLSQTAVKQKQSSDDLLDLGDIMQSSSPCTTGASASATSDTSITLSDDQPEWQLLLSPETPGTNNRCGVKILGCIYLNAVGEILLHFRVTNLSNVTLQKSVWAVQENKNSFGLSPKQPPVQPIRDIAPQNTSDAIYQLEPNVNLSQAPPSVPLCLQIAVRSSVDVFYLKPVVFDLPVVFVSKQPVTLDIFRVHWQRMGEAKQLSILGTSGLELTCEKLAELFRKHNILPLVQQDLGSFSAQYFAAVTTNHLLILLEVALQTGGNGIKLSMRADAVQLFPILKAFLQKVLQISESHGQ